MARVINRITKEYFESANTPDYDPSEWLINPDLSAVEGLSPQFWVINPDDTVRPMTTQEQSEYELTAPYQGMTVDQAKVLKKKLINSYRDKVLSGGWLYNGVKYDSDPSSVQNFSGTMVMISAGYTLPDTFVWRSSDNQDHPYNNDQFKVFFMAASMWREWVFRGSWALKAQVDALSTVEDVAAFDLTQGWVKGMTFNGTDIEPVF